MIRVNYASPSIVDSCSFYRGFGPLSELTKANDGFSLYHVNELNWATLNQIDVLSLPRVYEQQTYGALKMAINNFKPVWIDYDDNLFCVPRSNPSFAHFANKESILAQAAELASAITVTTEALYKTYKTYNKNTFIIPNAYNDQMFGPLPHHKGPKRKLLVWRGSNTHDEDLVPIADDLVAVVKSPEFSDWKILFIGYNPTYITCRVPADRVLYRDAMDIIDYFRYLPTLNAAMMVVPLADTEFNRCKSNIAWIEGTVMGAAVYASDLPEFRKPGIQNVSRGTLARTLLEAITQANKNGDFLQERYETSRAFVEENLYLSKVNQLRVDLLRVLAKK